MSDKHNNTIRPTSENAGKGSVSTDMMPEFCADENKLKPVDERILYADRKNRKLNGMLGGNNNSRESADENYENHNNHANGSNGKNKHQDVALDDNINDYADNAIQDDYDNNENENENENENNGHDNGNHNDGDNGTSGNNAKPTVADEENLSEEELMLRKLDMLRKLGELSNAGVKLSQNYNMKSDLKMMKYEYELHKSIRAKQNAINWMSNMLLNGIYAIEMLNDKYDPFGLKLKGWSEQMNADADNYYDVFGELYEKYSHPTKGMAPELKFLLMLSGSALKFHLSNQVINGSSNLNETLENNPELMEKLRRKATAEKLQQNNKNNESLNNKMSKEHEKAVEKANDLKMIKEKEIEFLNAQKTLAEKHAQLEQLKQGLQGLNTTKMNQQQQTSPQIPQQMPTSVNHNLNQPNRDPYVQLRQETMKRQILEQQMSMMQNNLLELKKQNEYFEKMNMLEKLEKAGIKNDSRSNSSAKSNKSSASKRSTVRYNKNIHEIFGTKKEQVNTIPQNTLVSENIKKKGKTSKLDGEAEASSVIAIDTIDKEDIDHISLGSKKSNKSSKSGKSGKSATQPRKKKNTNSSQE